MSLAIPRVPESENVRALTLWQVDRITGVAGSTLTLSQTADVVFIVSKNGAVLDPSTAYTVTGTSVALTAAAVVGDVFVIFYHFRP